MDINQWASGASEDLEVMEALLRKELEVRETRDPTAFFGWHQIQSWVLEEAPGLIDGPVRIILACGGNRGGKSALAKGIWSQTMRRMNPMSRQLQATDKFTGEVRKKTTDDSLTSWVIPPTLEKARMDWLAPSDGYSLEYWAGDQFVKHEKSPDNVVYTAPPGVDIEYVRADLQHRADKTIMKSQDQRLESFESSAVDLAIFDEEVLRPDIWASVLMRVGTANGFVVMAYTPLHGLTWSHDRYWKPLIKMGLAHKVADRCWIHSPDKGASMIMVQFGCADNPLAKDYAEEIEADPGMSAAEKGARLHGEYGFVEGSLIPRLAGLDVLTPSPEHETYVVDTIPGMKRKDGNRTPGRIDQWILMTDPNKSYGALLAAVDVAGNLFVITEHLEEAWPDRLHAKAFKDMTKRYATGLVRHMADPGSAGAHSIVNMADLGLYFEAVKKGDGSVAEGYKQLRSLDWIDPKHVHPITGEMGSPRVFFYRPGMISRWTDPSGISHYSCRLADQISQVRQTDNLNAPPDTPHKSVKSKLDLVDCYRYLALEVSKMSINPDEQRLSKRTANHLLPSLPLVGQPVMGDPLDRDMALPDYFDF